MTTYTGQLLGETLSSSPRSTTSPWRQFNKVFAITSFLTLLFTNGVVMLGLHSGSRFLSLGISEYPTTPKPQSIGLECKYSKNNCLDSICTKVLEAPQVHQSKIIEFWMKDLY